jgi:hypothetical protein
LSVKDASDVSCFFCVWAKVELNVGTSIGVEIGDGTVGFVSRHVSTPFGSGDKQLVGVDCLIEYIFVSFAGEQAASNKDVRTIKKMIFGNFI